MSRSHSRALSWGAAVVAALALTALFVALDPVGDGAAVDSVAARPGGGAESGVAPAGAERDPGVASGQEARPVDGGSGAEESARREAVEMTTAFRLDTWPPDGPLVLTATTDMRELEEPVGVELPAEGLELRLAALGALEVSVPGDVVSAFARTPSVSLVRAHRPDVSLEPRSAPRYGSPVSSWIWPRLVPGTYRLDLRASPEGPVLLSVPGLEVVDGEWSRDPRVNPIELHLPLSSR